MREQSGCLPAWPRRAEGFEPVTQGLEPLELSHVPGRKRGQAGQEGLEEQRLGAKREREVRQFRARILRDSRPWTEAKNVCGSVLARGQECQERGLASHDCSSSSEHM